MAEMKGFIFAVTFLVISTGLLAAMPTALYGLGETATTINDIDPNLISDFASFENWTKSTMYFSLGEYSYSYALGDYGWYARKLEDGVSTEVFYLDRKITWFGLWFGALEHVDFICQNGTNRGRYITFADIAGDAIDGTLRYNLQFTDNSNDAGGFVFYWNTTLYASPENAWDNNKLNLLHGMGVATPNTNVVALLLGLLTFQIPNIPVLPNLMIVTPIAVCVIFLLWFIIKESLPFW